MRWTLLAAACGTGVLSAIASAQPTEDLARYFGFAPMRTVVVDQDCGPMITGDINGDGRPDLVVVNNRKSRIELHLLRAEERTIEQADRQTRANELPPNPWYDRVDVSVPHRVTAVRTHDVDGDGMPDLVYAGSNPAELVIMRQTAKAKFEIVTRRRTPDLSSRQGGFHIADLVGDDMPELIAMVDGKVQVFPLNAAGVIGDPLVLASAGALAAAFPEDFDGDGKLDLLAVSPDDAAPLRLWLQRQDPRSATKRGLLGAETRFEMPQLREVEPVRFPGRSAASIGVIEKASRRIVFYDYTNRPGAALLASHAGGAEMEAQAEITGFSDGANKDRSVAVADIDGDGLPDLIATDARTNSIVVHRQSRGVGLGRGEAFSAFKKPKTVAMEQWDGIGPLEVFVLSEEEKTVGIASFDPDKGRLGFPLPLTIKTAGAAPVAMATLRIEDKPVLAVVVKVRRDHTLELHSPDGEVRLIELKNVNRPPQSILAADPDQDGITDLLLFTPGEPMVMVRGTGESGEAGFVVLTDAEMPQFGLVQAAGPDNTALLDVTGNGRPELLIADENYVRACTFDVKTGWRVVEQVTVRDTGARLTGLATLGDGPGAKVVAADRANGRLLILARERPDDPLTVSAKLRVRGFQLAGVWCGPFGGNDEPAIMCTNEEGFALVRLSGQRAELAEFAAYRAESELRVEHELQVGDVNGDGYVDVVVLDAGEQMCQVLTFSAARKLHMAMEFEVFQTRLFSGGAPRQFEPRSAVIADATGDAKHDLILLVHDRVQIYPQPAKP